MENKTRIGAGYMITMLQANLGHDEFMQALNSAPRRRLPPPRPVKHCRICKEPHKHNNDFCSADCCKVYREQKIG